MNATVTGLKLDLKVIQQYIDKKWLRHKEKGNLQILCYSEITSRKPGWEWDDITRRCRGIVINKNTGEVVAHCMPKSFNANERPETLSKDLNLNEPCHITTKLDGSMILSFIDPDTGEFIHTTKCSFDTVYSQKAKEFFPEIPLLYTGYTFVSEIRLRDAEDEMRRVTRCKPGLYVITIFDKEGREVTPKRCKDIVEFLNIKDLHTVEHLDNMTLKQVIDEYPHLKGTEGFVVRFQDGRRIKFKTAWYRELNYLLDEMNNPIQTRQYVKDCFLREMNREWIKSLPKDIQPELNEAVDKLVIDFGIRKQILEKILKDIKGMSRKEVGIAYNRHPYAQYIFLSLDGKSAEDIDKAIWEKL